MEYKSFFDYYLIKENWGGDPRVDRADRKLKKWRDNWRKKDKFGECFGWENFIKANYLQDFVDEDKEYNPIVLFPDDKNEWAKPKSKKDWEKYFKKTAGIINERNKRLRKAGIEAT